VRARLLWSSWATDENGTAVSCTSAGNRFRLDRTTDGEVAMRWRFVTAAVETLTRGERYSTRARNEDVSAAGPAGFQDLTVRDSGSHRTQTRPTGRSVEIYGEYTSGPKCVVTRSAYQSLFRNTMISSAESQLPVAAVPQHYILFVRPVRVLVSPPSVANRLICCNVDEHDIAH